MSWYAYRIAGTVGPCSTRVAILAQESRSARPASCPLLRRSRHSVSATRKSDSSSAFHYSQGAYSQTPKTIG
eukprot:6443777-Pyramimonas_sp.AAC.1